VTLNARATSSSVVLADAIVPADGARVLVAEAVAQLEHTPLPIREVLERVAQGFVGQILDGALVGRLSLFVGRSAGSVGSRAKALPVRCCDPRRLGATTLAGGSVVSRPSSA
jgi:hypothetical protein